MLQLNCVYTEHRYSAKRSTLSSHSLHGDLSADNAITVSSFPVTPCLSCDLITVSIWLHARLSVCHARPYHCLYLTSCTSFCDLMYVMHDLTIVFIWLSCTSFCDLMSVNHDLTIVFIWPHACLSVTSCPSQFDFVCLFVVADHTLILA